MNGFLEALRHPKEKLQELRQRTESHRAQGARLLEAGNFAEAEASFRLAVAETRGSASRRAGLWLQLGEAQCKQAKLAEAEESSLQALKTAMAGQDVGLQALCLHALGEVLTERGDLSRASAALEDAIRIDAHRNGPDPELMARRLRQLGIVFHRLGRAGEATARLREAAALYEKTLGEMHADTGRALAELGAAYRAQGKYTESEECFRRALHIHGRCLGRQSREALRDLSELGRTLSEAGDLKGAIAEYERALAVQESMIGGRFEELAEMQLTLAGLCADTASYGRAQELLTHAVGGFKSTGGSRLAIAYEALAHVQESLGHLARALTELERAAPVWESCGRMEELRANAEHRAAIVARMPKEEEKEEKEKSAAG